eukprot:Gregarina_sp_Poly_1__9886@NODE_643_length_6990_cov_94_573595_g61_i1_p2_GENE_NODE_643_length_6990_cov_94_573595_g61_i1NODE_643_length_6990_cov_94_573595_g61_i1_p2_ORF_typecomplete_len627_score99_75_NODE_643_length_6990_cov_94_573595_g61_i19582838
MAVCTGCMICPSQLGGEMRVHPCASENLCAHGSARLTQSKPQQSLWQGSAGPRLKRRRLVAAEAATLPVSVPDSAPVSVSGSNVSLFDASTWQLLHRIPVVSALLDEFEASNLRTDLARRRLQLAGRKECTVLTAYLHKSIAAIHRSCPFPSQRRDRRLADLFTFVARIYRDGLHDGYLSDVCRLRETAMEETSSRSLVSGLVTSAMESDSRLRSLSGWSAPWMFDWGDAGADDELWGLEYLRSLREDTRAGFDNIVPRMNELSHSRTSSGRCKARQAVSEDNQTVSKANRAVSTPAEHLEPTETGAGAFTDIPEENDIRFVRKLKSAELASATGGRETAMPEPETTRAETETGIASPPVLHQYRLRARRTRRQLQSPFEELRESDASLRHSAVVSRERKSLKLKVQLKLSSPEKRRRTPGGEDLSQFEDQHGRKSLKILSSRKSHASNQRPPKTGSLSSLIPLTSPSELGGSSPRVECLMEYVKRLSGWHPYVWYVMSRRPELEAIGLRAPQIAPICGREWEDLQLTHGLLCTFLIATLQFLCRYPVPTTHSKKDIREYCLFLSRELHTPNHFITTTAVRDSLLSQSRISGGTKISARPSGSGGKLTPASEVVDLQRRTSSDEYS